MCIFFYSLPEVSFLSLRKGLESSNQFETLQVETHTDALRVMPRTHVFVIGDRTARYLTAKEIIPES